MHTFLGVITALIFLIFFMVFRFWKKSSRIKLYDPPSAASASIDWKEKRDYPRFETDWPASIETPDGFVDAAIINASQDGAFIRCRKPLPASEIFNLKISMPGKEPIESKARVVWSNENVPQDRVVNRGMGVQFIRQDQETKSALKSALSSCVLMK